MSNSSITSEISNSNIEYQNSEGENIEKKKNLSTDTDYYFNLVANPSKLKPVPNNIESSEIIEEINDSATSKKSSKSSKKSSIKSKSSDSNPVYDKINITNSIKEPFNNTTHNNNTMSAKVFQPQGFQPQRMPQAAIPQSQFGINQNPNINPSTQSLGSNVIKNPNIIPLSTSDNSKILTPHEIKIKKIELLRKLSEIKAKGYQLSKDYDFNSTIDEMEYEYELLRSFADKRNGVKIFRNSLLQAVSVVEFLNDKYDPFDFHLSGWSEHVSIEIDTWEDVLEELYEKYKGSGRKMAPEIKLLYLMIASASAFHFTRAHASKLPGLDSLLASNPGLLSSIINSKKESSQFMTQQEINLEKQKNDLKNKEKNDQSKYISQLQEQIKQQQQVINNTNRTSQENQSNNFNNQQSNNLNNQQSNRITTIRAPDQVKEILNRLHNIKPTNTDTQDELSSNNDRLVSETTISENKSQKKNVKKTKKTEISIL